MKYSILFLSLLLVTPVMADESLLKKNNCLACHSVDKKLVGPAYKDIANKYRGESGAAEKLSKKIRSGGSGVWGPIPMPAYANMPEADSKKIADYILGLK